MTFPSETRDQQVANMLPVEIWHSILRIAITSPWPLPVMFMPPPDDLTFIQGFRKASSFFEKIAADIHSESVDLIEFSEFLLKRDRSCRPEHVRHMSLRINDQDLIDIANLTDSLEDFRLLQSFSLDTSHIVNLPCPSNLVRLDFAPLKPSMILQSINLSPFKNLEELRMRSREHPDFGWPGIPDRVAFLHLIDDESFPMDEVKLANHILEMIRPLFRLRLISLRAALDPTQAFLSMKRQHISSLEHLVPSEGYARHYSDCPMCTEAYDHGAVIRAENTATRILAEGMPSLERVLWANAWMRWMDENGQRGTNITREVNDTNTIITLFRDDGKDA